MGCRRYFAASRLEVLLDEDRLSIFFTSSANAEVFCLFHKLHVAIQTLWPSDVYFLELSEQTCWLYMLGCPLHGSLRSVFDLTSTFSPNLRPDCLYATRSHSGGLAHNLMAEWSTFH